MRVDKCGKLTREATGQSQENTMVCRVIGLIVILALFVVGCAQYT